MRRTKQEGKVLILTLSILLAAFLISQGDAAEEGENILFNPDFDLDKSGWDFNVSQPGWAAEFKIDESIGGKCALIEISEPGTGAFGIQLRQMGTGLEGGNTYTFAVWLKTESGATRTLELRGVGRSPEDKPATYKKQVVTITDEWAEYHTTWEQPVDDLANGRVGLLLGTLKEAVWIDHVRHYIGEYEEDILGGVEKAMRPQGKLATTWANLKVE